MRINLPQDTSRKNAIRALRKERLSTPGAKLFVHQGCVTQPGKGLVAFVNYYIELNP